MAINKIYAIQLYYNYGLKKKCFSKKTKKLRRFNKSVKRRPLTFQKNYLKTIYFNLTTVNHKKNAKSYNTLALIITVIIAHRHRRDVCIYFDGSVKTNFIVFDSVISAFKPTVLYHTHI